MDVIKLENGWKILDTNEFIDFGQISLDVYNHENFIIEETDRSFQKLFPELKSASWEIVSCYHPRCDYEKKLFEKYPEIIALISSTVDLRKDNKFNYEYSYCGYDRLKEDRYAYPINKDWVRKLQAQSGFDDDFLLDMLVKYSSAKKRCRLLETLFRDRFEANFCNHDDYVAFFTDLVKSHLNDALSTFYKLETVPRWDGVKLYRAYIIEDKYDLYFDDYAEIINCKYGVARCPICKNLFIQKDKRKNFCPVCSKDKIAQRKYNEQKRQRSPRYLRKVIIDMLKNRGDIDAANEFYEEAIYYENIIDQKEQDINPKYTDEIHTNREYKEWLEKKHNQYLKRPRNPSPAS